MGNIPFLLTAHCLLGSASNFRILGMLTANVEQRVVEVALVEIRCCYYEGNQINKAEVTGKGVQRYRCKSCSKRFQLEYRYNGNKPGVADKVVDMALNGSGVRDTSRVLKVSQNTVIRRLKKISASPSD